MKKKIMIAISSVTVAAVLGIGIYHSNAAQADPELSKAEIRELVKAQYPGTITEIELERSFNKAVYEVEVESNGKEYDIRLDGNTGEILKLEEKETRVAENNSNEVAIKEKNDDETNDKNTSNDDKNKVDDKVDDSSKQAQKDDVQKDDDSSKQAQKDDAKDDRNQSKKDNNVKTAVIDYEAAKKIALGEFPGTITDLELDEDDGRLIYEIEIESADGEAELEIDAYTGEVIYISIDTEVGVSNGTNNSGDSDDRSDNLEDDEDWDDDHDDN